MMMCSAGKASNATRLLGLAMLAIPIRPVCVTSRRPDVPSGTPEAVRSVPVAWARRERELMPSLAFQQYFQIGDSFARAVLVHFFEHWLSRKTR